MSFASPQFIYRIGFASKTSPNLSRIFRYAFFARHRRRFSTVSLSLTPKVNISRLDIGFLVIQLLLNSLCIFTNQSGEELLVVVGGGAAGVYGAINAKTVAPNLKAVVIEKGKPLSKVGLFSLPIWITPTTCLCVRALIFASVLHVRF